VSKVEKFCLHWTLTLLTTAGYRGRADDTIIYMHVSGDAFSEISFRKAAIL